MRWRSARGFTLVELLIGLVIVGILVAIAAPSFLGKSGRAKDSAAQQSLQVSRRDASTYYVTNGYRYANTTAAMISELQGDEPQYTYKAYDGSDPSTYSAKPTEVSVSLEDPAQISYCAKSLSGFVYCLRYDELGRLSGQASPGSSLLAKLGPLAFLAPENAQAGEKSAIAYSMGRNERDARAVLTSEATTATSGGPTCSGVQGWDSTKSPPVTCSPRLTSAPNTPQIASSLVKRDIVISWAVPNDADNDLVGYRVWRRNSDGTWPSAATAGVGMNRYVDSGLNDGLYAYKVQAYDSQGNSSGYSNIVVQGIGDSTSQTSRPPTGPSTIMLTASDSQAQLNWAAGSDADGDLKGYYVYRKQSNGSTWPSTATATVSGTSFTDTGLSNGTSYDYRVTAYDSIGHESSPSEIASVTPRADNTAPSTPGSPQANAGNAQITLTWSASSDADNNLTGYNIYRQASDGSWPSSPTKQVTSGTSWTDTGLTNGSTYTYKLTAYDSAGAESPATNTFSATPAAPWSAPTTPNGLIASAGNGQVSLSWAPASDPDGDLVGYHIWRQNPGGSWPQTPTATVTSANWIDTGLSNGQTYTYRVSAYDAGSHESGNSSSASATPTYPATAPVAPTGLTANGVVNGVNLSWSASTDINGDLVGYKVYRRNADLSWPATPTATVTATSWSDTGLSAGTSYTYRVTAYDATALESSPSGLATATASYPPTAPTIPGSLGASAGVQQVTLSWSGSSDVNGDLAGYRIYRQNADNSWPATPTATVTGATSWTDSGRTAGTSYTYRVTAYDGANLESGASNTASATPLYPATAPTQPGTLVVTNGGVRGQLNLSWGASTDVNGDLVGYKVYRQNPDTSWPATPTATIAAAQLSWSDSGLADSTTYYYRVAAYDAGGLVSTYTNTSSATTMAAPVAPTIPGTLTVTKDAAAGKLDLSWGASTDANGDLAGYRIYRQNADNSWPATPTATVTAPATSWVDTGLSDGTTYYYRVTAYDAGNLESAPGASASATTRSAPTVPTGLSVTKPASTTKALNLSWTASSDPDSDLSGYNIYRSATSGGTYTKINGSTVTGTSYSDTGLSDGTTYYYKITALDATALESAQTSSANATTHSVPSVPTGVSAVKAGAGQITISWTAASDADSNLSGYNVYRSATSGGTYTKVNGSTIAGTAYTDSGLANGTTYYYKVTSLDATSLESAQQGSAASAMTASVPTVPGTVTVAKAASAGTLTISWATASTDADSDLAGYRIYRSADGTTWPGTATLTAGAGATSISDTGLPNGTTYYYRVSAYDATALESATSPSAPTYPSAKTRSAPTTPSGLSATPSSATGGVIALSWTASTDADSDLAGYNIERSTNGGVSWSLIGTQPTVNSATTSYSDTGLTAGSSYSYRVTAVDGTSLTSSASTTASAVAPDPGPNPVTLRPASDGTCTSWTTQTTTGQTYFSQLNEAVTQPTAPSTTTGYIQSISNGATCIVNFGSTGWLSGATPTTVTLWVYGKVAATNKPLSVQLQTSGGTALGTAISVNTTTAQWFSTTYTAAAPNNTTAIWNALQIKLTNGNTSASPIYAAYLVANRS